MMNQAECDECRAIADELIGAYGEVPQHLRDELCSKLYTLSQTLFSLHNWEDYIEKLRPFTAQKPGEVLQVKPFPPRQVKIREAIRKMGQHQLRTGHTVLSK